MLPEFNISHALQGMQFSIEELGHVQSLLGVL
jgi:hypothetical protein